MLNYDTLIQSLANPDRALKDLDEFENKKSLLNFMKLGWHALEPEAEFVPNYAVAAICDHLEAVASGQLRRLLINVPPGTSKSMATNVFFPAWEWGPLGKPSLRYMSFSHEQGLAIRDNVRCRNLILSDWYQALYGDKFQFKSDQNAKVYYENTKTGWRQANSAESLTGRRGDRVLGDDPHSVKGADSDAKREDVLQIFSETVPTRLNKQAESAIIVIMQRVHERDVSGLILASELGYEHLMLPMRFESNRRCYSTICPSYLDNPKPIKTRFNRTKKCWVPVNIVTKKIADPNNKDKFNDEIQERYNVDARKHDGELLDPIRFPEIAVSELEKALSSWGGSYAVAGQLQQRPAPRGGGLFKRDDFIIIDSIKGLKGKFRRGWDFAGSKGDKSPYSASCKILLTLDKRVIICDVDRFKGTPGEVENRLKSTAKRDGKGVTIDIPQDPGQAGKSQIVTFLRLLHGFVVKHSPESGSKEDRAKPLAAQAEGGNVYLLRGEWNDAFINEATVFPNSEFKDQIDAASRAYNGLVGVRRSRSLAAGSVIGDSDG